MNWNDEDLLTEIEHSILEGDFTMKKFIQLNGTYINTDHIVSVNRIPSRPVTDGSVRQEALLVQTLAIESGIEEFTSCSATFHFPVDSKEGQALLRWLEGETEVLAPYEPVIALVEPEVNVDGLGSDYDKF